MSSSDSPSLTYESILESLVRQKRHKCDYNGCHKSFISERKLQSHKTRAHPPSAPVDTPLSLAPLSAPATSPWPSPPPPPSDHTVDPIPQTSDTNTDEWFDSVGSLASISGADTPVPAVVATASRVDIATDIDIDLKIQTDSQLCIDSAVALAGSLVANSDGADNLSIDNTLHKYSRLNKVESCLTDDTVSHPKTCAVDTAVVDDIDRKPYDCKPDVDDLFSRTYSSFNTTPDTEVMPKTAVSKQPFLCGENGCRKRFRTENQLKQHKSSAHSSAKKFCCDFDPCLRSFRTELDLVYHRVATHGLPLPHPCDVKACDQRFALKHVLNEHKRRAHGLSVPYECDREGCAALFDQKRDLNVHRRSAHWTDGSDCKPFLCDAHNCRKVFIRERDLCQHKLAVHSSGATDRKPRLRGRPEPWSAASICHDLSLDSMPAASEHKCDVQLPKVGYECGGADHPIARGRPALTSGLNNRHYIDCTTELGSVPATDSDHKCEVQLPKVGYECGDADHPIARGRPALSSGLNSCHYNDCGVELGSLPAASDHNCDVQLPSVDYGCESEHPIDQKVSLLERRLIEHTVAQLFQSRGLGESHYDLRNKRPKL
ncbi:unnamed protein product, partial [Medioppia subpectinata]